MWFNLPLSQAAVEHYPGADQEEHIGDLHPSQGTHQDAICTGETYRESIQCMKDLTPLVDNGFPWGLDDMGEIQSQVQNHREQYDNYRNPLDPIDHVCEVFGDFLGCLDHYAIPSECLLSVTGGFRVTTLFTFICKLQPRSTELLHSLQCLKESRVLDLLVFYLADRTGTRHTDDMAQGTVNALFKFLNSTELLYKYQSNALSLDLVVSQGLICLPESVISQDVSFIIDRKCGSHAAELVRDFYLYFRWRFNSVLSKIGFPTNICDKETRRNPTSNGMDAALGDTEYGIFQQFLQENSPGTALDTVYGRNLRIVIKSIPSREFCNPLVGLVLSFQSCVLLSYNPSGKARFNVLQYAHSIDFPPFTPSPNSSSLAIFRSCWNLLQQICGRNTTYYEYNYHVSADTREIQRMMDNVTCGWQDTLMARYAEASEQGNIWPTGYNAPGRPMLLSNGTYTFGNLIKSMPELLSVVSRGVKDISTRCGMASAERIMLFYRRLSYTWYAEVKLLKMLQEEHFK